MDRTFELRLPKLAEAKHGLEFTDDPTNWAQRRARSASRLVNAGVLDADAGIVGAYARDYGRRRPPLWLYKG